MTRNPQRAWEILDAVVRLNVETGRPVSSGLVERYLQRAYSSATIRNVMKSLEADGLLEQPHTSAGRQPTDAGYRAFVDRLLARRTLQPWDPPRPLQRAVEQGILRHAGSQAMIRVLAGLLSELAAGVSIILGPSWSAARARRLELYPKEHRRLLVVLILENALVRTSVLTLAREYPPEVVDEAARLLSERIYGRTVSEIRDAVLPTVGLAGGAAGDCAREVATDGRDLFAEFEVGELELEGVPRVLEEPEFGEPGTLKTLIRFIESPRSIRRALQRLDLAAGGHLGIWIGGENPVGELRAFAVVAHRFPLEGREGIMAVLGPRRMPYDRALTGIDMLCTRLRALS